jgi:mannosyltransferase OCH1-like enzyme
VETETTIQRLNAKEAPVVETIPKIIIQMWVHNGKGPKDRVPSNQAKYMSDMRKTNPGFQHLFFDKDDVETFFKSNYPEYYDTYNRLPAFIQKLDFFRYLAVYHYGGFYFDMDVEPRNPLDFAILNHHAVFPVDEYATDKSGTKDDARMKGKPFLLGQYAFGTTAKHPFLKFVVDNIKDNVDKYISVASRIKNASSDVAHQYVFNTTGPDFITECYYRYDSPQQIYILSNGKRQEFGQYGVHRYAGNWK